MFDTFSPGLRVLRGQLDPAVTKVQLPRSSSLKMRISPVSSSRCQTLDPACTLESGMLDGSRWVSAEFQLQVTLEKSMVVAGAVAARIPSIRLVAPTCGSV